jgi:tRNA-2-methylthio-N6-dimethylallyladenosine synthase
VRFTSPYPLDFSARVIDALARLPKVMPYLHLPMQSGCDSVLAAMKRGYTIGQFCDLVAELRARVPGLALSTDVIVGFPGESDASYARTLDVLEKLRFDSAFMFLYSERSGTHAAKHLPDDVPVAVKKDRLQRLIALQEAISAEINTGWIGRTVPILVAGPARRGNGQWTGKTPGFKTTVFSGEPQDGPVEVGQVVWVRVTSSTSHTLLGHCPRPPGDGGESP